MISSLLPILLQASAPAAVQDRVMLCSLRTARLADPSSPGRLVPEGPNRILAFRVIGPTGGRVEGSSVQIYDPTKIMHGRPIDYVLQQRGNTAFMARGSRDDMLALAVEPPAPARAGGDAYLTRVADGGPSEYGVGSCAFLPTRDPAGTFETIRIHPGTRP